MKSKRHAIEKIAFAFAVLLVLLIAFSGRSEPAYADTMDKGDQVWLGGQVWRVLDTDAVYNDSQPNQKGYLLITENVYCMRPYDRGDYEGNPPPRERWDASSVRQYLNKDFVETLDLNYVELSAIAIAKKDDANAGDVINCDPGVGLTGDLFFLLNEIEAFNKGYFESARDRIGKTADGTSVLWWLRSTIGSNDFWAGSQVGRDGQLTHSSVYVSQGVRPACYLKKSEVTGLHSTGAGQPKVIGFKNSFVRSTTDVVREMRSGVASLKAGADTEKAQTLYFGKDHQDNPAPWLVAWYSVSSSNIAASGRVMLLAKTIFGRTKFNETEGANNNYAGSTLQSKVDELAAKLTPAEREAVQTRTLQSGKFVKGVDCDYITGPVVLNAVYWPLSTKEAASLTQEFKWLDRGGDSSPYDFRWYLRSPAKYDTQAAYMTWNGLDGGSDTQDVWLLAAGVRPAFYLRAGSVLFTSAATGRTFADPGADAFANPGIFPNAAESGWKVTVIDQSRNDFDAALLSTTCEANEAVIQYENARTGTNEYVSAMIVDSVGAIKYYGRLKRCSDPERDKSGKVALNLGNKLGSEDTLYVFNEQDNGDYHTDNASEPKKIQVAPLGHDWYLESEDFTWTGNEKEGYTKAIAHFKCRNDASHTKDLEAEVTPQVVPPTCTEAGKTIYTATLSAANNCDGTEHTDSKDAQVTKAISHNWGAWAIIKEPTATEAGEKQRVCLNDPSHTEEMAVPALGEGASEETADEFMKKYASEEDPEGTAFAVLQLKAAKVTKKSITLKWKKPAKAVRFIVYGSKCGRTNPYKKQKETTGTTLTVKKISKKAVRKGTYYKFVVVALDSNGRVVSTSKSVHVATTGGKVGNAKKLTTKAKKNKVSLKVGKTFSLKAKQIKASSKLKVQKHRNVLYESSNKSIATVSKKGTIKGVAKGTCRVYVYAQNGICKIIKVTVK